MAEQLDFIQSPEVWEGQSVEKELKEIQIFFESPPPEEFLWQLSQRYPHIELTVSEEDNRDWLEEWKKGYEAFPLTSDFWIVPSWKVPPAEARNYLFIDPQMAFGTGTHDTTQIAAILLSKHLPVNTEAKVLDVGTGTGILAMMAQKRGASKVQGTEIDPDARQVARENCRLNKLPKVEILDEQIESLKGSYDWVIANIIDGILIKIQKDLLRLSQRYLLLTGILAERETQFLSEFQFQSSYKVIDRLEKGGWIGFLLERQSK